MSANYYSLTGVYPGFDDMDLMMISVVDGIQNPKTRALFRSVKIAGVSRTNDNSISVLLAFPSKLVSAYEYEEPKDFGSDSTCG